MATNTIGAGVVLNEGQIDVDFRVEGNNNANVLMVDGGNDRVGIGTAAPARSVAIYKDSQPDMQFCNSTTSTNSSSIGADDGTLFQQSGVDFYFYNMEAGDIFIGTNNSTDLTILDGGNVGIGTATPEGALDIQNGSIALIIGADVNDTSLTNDTRKFSRFSMHHYHNAEEQLTLIAGDSDGTDNIVAIGGMSGTTNSATQLRFYTAANDATTSGTERLQ